MCMGTPEFNCEFNELKPQRASRRAASIAKDRAAYQARKQAKTSSDSSPKFMIPHGAARSATRSGLAKQQITGNEEMPRISAGHRRKCWAAKPTVSKMLQTAQSGLITDPVALASPALLNEPRSVQLGLDRLEKTVEDTAGSDYVAMASETVAPLLVAAETTADVQKDIEFTSMNTDEDTLKGEPSHGVDIRLVASQLLCEAFQYVGVAALVESPTTTADEEADEWVVVASSNSTAVVSATPKRASSRSARSASARRRGCTSSVRAPSEIDWSSTGIPMEMKRQLLHASRVASHRSVYDNEQSSTSVSIKTLRSQSFDSRRKDAQRMTSASRQRSKPRNFHQPTRK